MTRTPISDSQRDFATSDDFLEDLFCSPPPAGSAGDRAEFSTAIRRFYASTLDEVRLRRASEVAGCILRINQDEEDSSRLRRAVQRRELGQTTENPTQRDHLVHTLNSYLLGWRIFKTSALFRKAFARAVGCRGLVQPDYPVQRAFRALWSPVSLLHDIGYIFEGSIDAQSDAQSHQHAANAAGIVNDLGRSWSLFPEELKSEGALRWLIAYARQTFGSDSALEDQFRIKVGTLLDTASSLAEIGPLPAFSNALGRSAVLPTNIFDIWQLHHDEFGSELMERAMPELRRTYFSYAVDGLPGPWVRIVDHAVASGLIMTTIDTLFHELHFTALHAATNSKAVPAAIAAYATAAGASGGTYTNFTQKAHWAWNMWSASAAATHNIAQTMGAKLFGRELTLEDDPLTYLGILVDELQEWDRYTVRRSSAFYGQLPVQGSQTLIDVALDAEPAVRLTFVAERDQLNKWEEKFEKTRRTLSFLHDWQRLGRSPAVC